MRMVGTAYRYATYFLRPFLLFKRTVFTLFLRMYNYTFLLEKTLNNIFK